MASVIARGTLISPGFSRPSVIWCMLRLHGRRGGNGGVEGWGWSEQSGLTTMHGGTRATRTDALTDMHTCVWMFTKTLIPAFLFSPSKRPQGAAVKASRARTHARMHVCMQCCFFLHSYYVSIYVSLRRFLVAAQFLWKIFPQKASQQLRVPVNQLILMEPKKVILVGDSDFWFDAMGIFFFLFIFFCCSTSSPFQQGSVPTTSQTFIQSLLPELHHGTG